jgi:fatty-acyl-CoA synthase
MKGQMQDWPLTVNRFLDHAATWHSERELISRREDGSIERTTYAQVHRAAQQLANALRAYGIEPGDRIATLAMNSAEHVQCWYAIPGIGAVCHTLNPRMQLEQIAYIANHAADRLIFADGTFAPLLAQLLPSCPRIERVIYLSAPPLTPALSITQQSLQQFVQGHSVKCCWGHFDENTAAGLCYTSGTTGHPKGVLYSHRSNFLHTLMVLQPDVFGLSVRDRVMPVVPMYHANAWELVFAAPAVGATLVLPGARLDGRSIFELLDTEAVTITAGVPTVWFALLQHMAEHGLHLPLLQRVLVGGAACPEQLIRHFAQLGIEAIHAWGMTEMSSVGSVGTLTPELLARSFDEQMPWRVKQGRATCGIEYKLVNADGQRLPHDGQSRGHLQVRGLAVVSGYFGDARPVLDAEGYFDTGDIATIDAQGCMQIVDRARDIIKSGGEWISSLAIEDAAQMHPKVAIASVIGTPDARWGERPLLLVILKEGETIDAEELLQFMRGRLPKWHIPNQIAFVREFPLGPTGKIDKRRLREIHSAGGYGPR